MSLPSKAIFYKEGKEVKRLFCNCGWFWTKDFFSLLDHMCRYGYNEDHPDNPNNFDWDEVEAYGDSIMRVDIKDPNEKKVTKFVDDSQNVTKYVFENDSVCYEAVLYRYPTYEERTVLCISTQCGCPVGCTFCGTGKKFVRSLSANEICEQIDIIFADIGLTTRPFDMKNENSPVHDVKKLQIMFMSMGEPFLNYHSVKNAIEIIYDAIPSADLLVSTIGPNKEAEFADFIDLSKDLSTVGLQFSIHKANDDDRDELIPFKDKMLLWEIRNYGVEWYAQTGRRVYLNYCLDGTNGGMKDAAELIHLFPPNAFAFTFSVVCSADETMKDAAYRNLEVIRQFEAVFQAHGYDTRVFDPAGQDSIGGGCGQLWYVQKWMKEKAKK